MTKTHRFDQRRRLVQNSPFHLIGTEQNAPFCSKADQGCLFLHKRTVSSIFLFSAFVHVYCHNWFIFARAVSYFQWNLLASY